MTKSEESPQGLMRHNQKNIIYVVGIPGEEKEKRTEQIFKEIMG